jgi:1-acyl-sn-glycerol-3-phosphate acyltransferase
MAGRAEPRRTAAGGANPAGKILYRAGRGVVWALLRLVARPAYESCCNVPRHGPLLVVANHTSYVDPMLLALAVPRPLAFLAKEELFHPAPWGWALRTAGIIPVRRGRVDRHALDAALEVLRAGGALAIFAEGTRSSDGRLQAAEPGAGLLAARSGAPVLPVALLGTERLRSLAAWRARPRLLARCGPVWQPAAGRRGGSAAYRQIADEMMARVAALMPESRRGAYAQARDGARATSASLCWS